MQSALPISLLDASRPLSFPVNSLSVRHYFVLAGLANFLWSWTMGPLLQFIYKTNTMTQKILITKFNYSLPHPEFRDLLLSVAGEFASVPGCQWKIWLIDEEKNEGGAVYLFNSGEALGEFKESPLVQSVLSHPALSNFDLRVTDILYEPSALTRAPILETVTA